MLSVGETREAVNRLRQRFPKLSDPPSDDICYATRNHQIAMKAIAPKVDVMIVIGSANSSNPIHLAEVALEAGAGGAHRVDKTEELKPEWLGGMKIVGLTSGTFVPEIPVREVVERLQTCGLPTAEVVRTENETITSALPRNLHTELVGKGLADTRPHTPRKAGPNRTR